MQRNRVNVEKYQRSLTQIQSRNIRTQKLHIRLKPHLVSEASKKCQPRILKGTRNRERGYSRAEGTNSQDKKIKQVKG